MTPFPPFDDSRRLTGPNLHFAEPGAVLDTRAPVPADAQLQRWHERVQAMRATLGWPIGPIEARRHRAGALLAFAAPVDQLFCATEVNEWAWLATLHDEAGADAAFDPAIAVSAMGGIGIDSPAPAGAERTRTDARSGRRATERRDHRAFHAPGHPAAHDADSAIQTLQRLAAAEREPMLAALQRAARGHGLRLLLDDELVTLGSGEHAQSWPRTALPRVEEVDWHALRDVPSALVTGSNGKTTTVRLLAAMLRAHGLRCGWTCTDGLYFEGERIEGGDYSGPAGARAVLRHPQVQAAVLETARGGLLRRGLALERADVAVVTNISVDHFGEYGIDDLDGLAEVKLIVARALHGQAPLVLNADDPVLARHAPAQPTLAWFALDDAHPRLVAHRAQGGTTCGIAAGTLQLHRDGAVHRLGAVASMPLGFDGRARYNLANIAAASLAAAALGIAPATIAQVLSRFGAARDDNPGRLQRWHVDGVTVLVDYAHNVDGLRGLLAVAQTQRAAHGRLGLLLGQAGNRGDLEIRELADVVAEFRPARVVLKDLAQMLRGRRAGDVPALLHAALRERRLDEDTIEVCLDEAQAARRLLDWASAGDVVVLPLHAPEAREAVVAWLEQAIAS